MKKLTLGTLDGKSIEKLSNPVLSLKSYFLEKPKSAFHGYIIDLDMPPLSLIPCILPGSQNRLLISSTAVDQEVALQNESWAAEILQDYQIQKERPANDGEDLLYFERPLQPPLVVRSDFPVNKLRKPKRIGSS